MIANANDESLCIDRCIGALIYEQKSLTLLSCVR